MPADWQPPGSLSQGTAVQSPPLPTLHELRIHDLTINYRAESNYRLSISHFNTSKLLTDTPFDVSTGIQIEDDDGTVNLEIDATGQLIYASNQRLRFDRLVSNIRAEPDLAFNMTASGELHPERQVILLNDDYTPMEFVVLCLQRFFRMSMDDATRVMLHVHQRGVGVCGVFSYEVAETKVAQVIDFARANQHPLQCTLEKA